MEWVCPRDHHSVMEMSHGGGRKRRERGPASSLFHFFTALFLNPFLDIHSMSRLYLVDCWVSLVITHYIDDAVIVLDCIEH